MVGNNNPMTASTTATARSRKSGLEVEINVSDGARRIVQSKKPPSRKVREKGGAALSRLLCVGDYEVDGAGLVGGYGDGLLPGSRFGEDGALYAAFGEDVVGLLFAAEAPTFVPGDDLVGPGRHVGELEVSNFVGDGVVRMS